MQTSGCLPAWLRWRTSDVRWLALLPHCAPACAVGQAFVYLGSLDIVHTAPTYAVEQAAIMVQGVWRKRQGWKMLMAAMASVWSKTVDPSTGAVYYYNYRTGEAKWEKPLLFGGKDVEDFAGHLEEMQKLSGRSRCCSEARTWRTSRANSKRCRPNNEKR